jgi:hypothetical protein
MTKKVFAVPDHVLPYVDTVATCLREAAAEAGATDATFNVARPTQEQMHVSELIPPTLFVIGGVASWFTKKWVDTYVWPKLQRLIDNASRNLIEWLFAEGGMNIEFTQGQRVRSKKPGVGEGTVVSKDVDAHATQVMAPGTIYAVNWDDGNRETQVSADELEAI